MHNFNFHKNPKFWEIGISKQCRPRSVGSNMRLIMRKPVFGVSDQVRLKPACSATEASQSLEISAIASRGIILSRQRTTKALIRLHGCAGWSAPLLSAYGIIRFSHDVAYMRSLIRVYTVCHSFFIFWMHWCMLKPPCSDFRIITAQVSGILMHVYLLPIQLSHVMRKPVLAIAWSAPLLLLLR